MKRSLLFIFVLTLMAANAMSQSIDNSFFQKVSYVGAFDGINDWTAGWTEWDPVNANYPEPTITKGNGQFSRSEGLHITTSETWSGVINLNGWVYVDAGATLTIDAGTIIRATNKSVLSVEKGGKIMAVGTSAEPIVFTSSQGAGFRSNSDWAGLVINGDGINNLAGGSGTAEGGIGSPYGGADNTDNSGVLAYVRIEFPGYEVATGSEVNGLTLNAVGSGTTIDHVQVSYSGDDGFEFFGGAVNAKHLISYKTEDDDFDTDNGYSGMVQFTVILRDPTIVDTDTANGFESDNDSNGSDATPKTTAIFSNMSGFGAAKDLDTYNTLTQNHKEGATMRIRRNSRISVYNSLYLGWGRGLRFESSGTQTAANAGEMTVKNTFIGDVFGDKYKTDAAVMSATQLEEWFLEATKKNKVLTAGSDAKITDPFNATEPNFQPMTGSPVFNASYWFTTPIIDVKTAVNNFSAASYPNPFNGSANIEIKLTEDAAVNVVVFNLAGAVVSQVYNGELYKGTHRFRFEAGELPKGMYFGKVMVGNQVQTLKMIAQ